MTDQAPIELPVLPAATALQGWITAAWLLAVEGRALFEDHEGGERQPELRRAVAARLVELLAQVDLHLRGACPVAEEHLLALALERGAAGVAPDALLALLGAADPATADAQLEALWTETLASFPGELPDPLQPNGQGALLRALRQWSRACETAGLDAAFLEPLLKDA
jgi:hypothetical protein